MKRVILGRWVCYAITQDNADGRPMAVQCDCTRPMKADPPPARYPLFPHFHFSRSLTGPSAQQQFHRFEIINVSDTSRHGACSGDLGNSRACQFTSDGGREGGWGVGMFACSHTERRRWLRCDRRQAGRQQTNRASRLIWGMM